LPFPHLTAHQHITMHLLLLAQALGDNKFKTALG